MRSRGNSFTQSPDTFSQAPAPVAAAYGASPPAAQGPDTGPCTNFRLNMSSNQFGICHCGFDRNAHNMRPFNSPAVTNNQATNGHGAAAPQSGPSSRTSSLQELQQRRQQGNFSGMDPKRLEDYLQEQAFSAALGMSPAQFGGLPAWKREQMKKKGRYLLTEAHSCSADG